MKRAGATAEGTVRRIAVVGSPRSGTTWLSHLLADAYDLEHRHSLLEEDIDWEALPERCLLQTHLFYSPETEAKLAEEGFTVVVIARHPLDTLISLLQWMSEHPEDDDGIALMAVSPCGEGFVRYSAHRWNRLLLQVSREWSGHAIAVTRYEDLVASPEKQLQLVLNHIGGEPRRPIEEIVAANDIAQARQRTSEDHHFWQGRPGIWRELVPPRFAERILELHRPAFDAFGYHAKADPQLTESEAERAWLRMRLDRAQDSARLNRDKLRTAHARIAELEGELAARGASPDGLSPPQGRLRPLRRVAAAARRSVRPT